MKIKSQSEIQKMRVAGRKAADVLDMIQDHVKIGVSTEDLNQVCHEFIVDKLKGIPATLNYKGRQKIPFPKSICTSLNDEVCHGIPSPDVILKDGDILNIDVTVIFDGYHGDTSRMFMIGNVSQEAKTLVLVTRKCMEAGIKQVKPGARIGAIGQVIEEIASYFKHSVVREYGGHGIGELFHDEPSILHYARRDWGPEMVPGMTFTIEPMINIGSHEIRHAENQWTALTKDGSLSAQWEHTVLVTEDGHEVLTNAAD